MKTQVIHNPIGTPITAAAEIAGGGRVNNKNEYMCPICGEGTLCTDSADDPKWGRAYCNRCDCGGPEVRTGYDENIDAPWRADARKQFVDVVNEHVSKRCLEWVKTSDRLPAEADAGVDEEIVTIYDDGDTRMMGVDHWKCVALVPGRFPYWLPVPKLPELEQT